jgi:hypothetical protein
MIEAIISLAVSIVMVLFIAGFIAAANTSTLSSTDILLLGFVPTLSLVMTVWLFVKAIRDTKFGL